MLNNPRDEPTATPADESQDSSNSSHAKQIILIAVVGGYLFGMVWVYAHLPWLAVTVTGVAAVMIVLGFINRLREGVVPPEE